MERTNKKQNRQILPKIVNKGILSSCTWRVEKKVWLEEKKNLTWHFRKKQRGLLCFGQLTRSGVGVIVVVGGGGIEYSVLTSNDQSDHFSRPPLFSDHVRLVLGSAGAAH